MPVRSVSELKVGEQYIIVSEDKKVALGDIHATTTDVRAQASVSFTDTKIVTEVNTQGMPHTLILGGAADAYTLYDAQNNSYLGYTAGTKNKLESLSAPAANTLWSISIEGDGMARISPNTDKTRYIRYNSQNSRFACYSTNSLVDDVKLYRMETPTAVQSISKPQSEWVDVYNLAGQRVKRRFSRSKLQQLPAGVYVIEGKKVLVK
mgnify:FL=1